MQAVWPMHMLGETCIEDHCNKPSYQTVYHAYNLVLGSGCKLDSNYQIVIIDGLFSKVIRWMYPEATTSPLAEQSPNRLNLVLIMLFHIADYLTGLKEASWVAVIGI